MTPEELKEHVIDLPFLSFNTNKINPNDIQIRTDRQPAEKVRVYYVGPLMMRKGIFFVVVQNRKKTLSGWEGLKMLLLL